MNIAQGQTKGRVTNTEGTDSGEARGARLVNVWPGMRAEGERGGA